MPASWKKCSDWMRNGAGYNFKKNSLAARGGMGQGWTGTFEQLAEYLVKL
jgi:uncharacterized protein YndB with AHSA1/START domain